jgi:hypothetical protein
MARNSRPARRRGLPWLQITVWVVTALVVLSMVLSMLPVGQ